MINPIANVLEKSLNEILDRNSGIPVYLLSLGGEINGRSKGRWGISVHFEDEKLPGGVRHEALEFDESLRNGLSQELADSLTEWIKETNARLGIPRPPRIELYVSY